MLVNLSIALHALPISMLTSFLVDEILLPRYMDWSTNFKDLSINEEIVWFGLVWFYGISTFVGYLMPNPLYTYILDIYDL